VFKCITVNSFTYFTVQRTIRERYDNNYKDFLMFKGGVPKPCRKIDNVRRIYLLHIKSVLQLSYNARYYIIEILCHCVGSIYLVQERVQNWVFIKAIMKFWVIN
jgi:hypothetical protein